MLKKPKQYDKVEVKLKNKDIKVSFMFPNGEWSENYDVEFWRELDLINIALDNLDEVEGKFLLKEENRTR